MDIDVSRACCDIGNMDVAYAIAICCINTSKVHMCLELGTIIDIYIYIDIGGLAFSLLVLVYAAMIWMVNR